jgi:disulfide bond formation protein DsbB
MTQRIAFLFGFLIVVGILGMGFYLEYYQGIMPCPLCTLQRISFGICGTLFFFGFLLVRKPVAVFIINLFSMLFAAAGLLLAGRQIWIQSNPDLVTGDCGVSLNYMLSVLPVTDVAQKIFSGSTECSQRGWEFLKLNIPEWSFIFFGLFLLSSLYFLSRSLRKSCRR